MNKLFTRSMRKDKKGIAVTALVGAIIAIAVMLYFGMLINSKVKGNISRSSFTTAENTTFDNTVTNVNTGFELTGLMPLILVAVAIIGLFVGGAFTTGRM